MIDERVACSKREEQMRAFVMALFAGMMGCTFVQPGSAAAPAKYTEKVLYSFCSQPNCTDGLGPTIVIDVKGTLFGTTIGGGITGCGGYGCGTVFSFDPSIGAEKVLYGFCSQENCTDGEFPNGGLIDVKGTFYGTTNEGGSGGDSSGTAFALNPQTGAETVLHSFCSQEDCSDGEYPAAGLIDWRGVLYGTTQGGGTGLESVGTAYALDPTSGTEKVLHSFCSQQDCADGRNPDAALIEVNGMLYGTTAAGGTHLCDDSSAGCGTVYSIDPNTGTETVVYSFCSQQNCTDGVGPLGSLIDVNGTLYGTTVAGGITGCGANGCGTVFSIDPNTGAEKVIYAFCSEQNCADGATPFASLIDVKGRLYGATGTGGGTGCGGAGCGTVFSIDLETGAETVLYAFCHRKNCADGAYPYGLIAVKGTLYGTTSGGGTNGDGTVFALTKR
jgi:uncharacterized repeat protein (TIGR03803 family)